MYLYRDYGTRFDQKLEKMQLIMLSVYDTLHKSVYNYVKLLINKLYIFECFYGGLSHDL